MEKLDHVARYDRGQLHTDAIITDEGYIRANAIVTRTGVFNYRNPDGTLRKELRHPDDVFNQDSLNTMSMIPITNNHPPERLVNSKNAKTLAIGYTGEKITHDDMFVVSSLVISDESGVRAVKDQGRKELSLGYTVDLVKEDGEYEGQKYDYRQKNIRYNHLSLVDKARAGAAARINLDANDAEEIEGDLTTMAEVKESLPTLKLDGKEYEAHQEVINHLDAANKEIESLKNDLETLKAERDTFQERLDNAESQNKYSEGELQKEIQKAVKETVQLVEIAKQVLDGETLDKIDTLDKREIQKLVIKACSPKANLDSATDVYIQARFDACVEDLPKRKENAIAQANEALTVKSDAAPKKNIVDEARERYLKALKTNFKGE